MSMPAARLGDPTVHGGTIAAGYPSVLIGGAPAARMGDPHVCPMCTPGAPPVPHVGGPVAIGSSGVLIGGLPAARMGDMCTCVGPPDTIAAGCGSVLIGEVKGGSGGGGGGAAASARASANVGGLADGVVVEPLVHWVGVVYRDAQGRPVRGEQFTFEDTEGRVREGVLGSGGSIWADGLDRSGTCRASLHAVSAVAWSTAEAVPDEAVGVSAEVLGYPDGTPATVQVLRLDADGGEQVVGTVETTVSGGRVEVDWTYRWEDAYDPEAIGPDLPWRLRAPIYRAAVIVGPCVGRSGPLRYRDHAELVLETSRGEPLANERIVVLLPDGSARAVTLDGQGRCRLENVPPGRIRVEFPDGVPRVDGPDPARL